jgi:nitrite reductase (NADH) large subunit
MARTIGIIGNGVTAVTATREIARIDSSVKIDVFTDERHAYYPRPRLIDFIAGRVNERDIIQYDQDWYEKQGAQLHLSQAAVKVDPEKRSVTTHSSTHPGYDAVLVGVGSYPFVPPIQGMDKRGVYVLRTLDDAITIRETVSGSGKVIVVGGGILGIELAAAIRESGQEPIVVTNIDTLLPAQLDRNASDLLTKRLEKLGIKVLTNFTCKQVTGDEKANGAVSTAGDIVAGDMVIAATGVKPNVELAKATGIGVGKGIIVDERMQTSVPKVFAAGDCIEWKGAYYGIIPVALETAKIAAQNMLKPGSAKYEGTIPSNTLQVAGIDLTSMGVFNPQTPDYELLVQADPKRGSYLKVVSKDGIAVGGIAYGDRKFAIKLRGLVMNRKDTSKLKNTIFETD